MDLAKHSLPQELFDAFGIEHIVAKDVNMSPSLIGL